MGSEKSNLRYRCLQIGDGMSTSADRVGETQGTRPRPLGQLRFLLVIVDIGDQNDRQMPKAGPRAATIAISV